MGTVKLRFFANFKEIIGQKEMALSIENHTSLQEILLSLERRLPAMKIVTQNNACRIAVNQQIVSADSLTISDGDEIAFLPPFSGG